MSYQVPDWTFYIIPKENKIEIKKFLMTSIMSSPTVKDWCSKPKMKNVPQCQTSLTIAFVFLIFGVDTGKITFWIFSSSFIDIWKIYFDITSDEIDHLFWFDMIVIHYGHWYRFILLLYHHNLTFANFARICLDNKCIMQFHIL